MIAEAVIFLICAPFIWWYLFLQKYKSLDVIPGPRPLPLIGNSLDIGTTPQEVYRNSLKLSKKYDGLYKLYIGNEVKVFVARANLLEKILSSTVHITKSDGYYLLRSWIGEGILVSAGDKWKTRRKMITPSFHFKILEKFLEIFNSQSDILTQLLVQEVGKNSFDVYPYVNLFSLDVICETSMGVKIASQEGRNRKYVQAVHGYMDIFISRFFSPWERYDTLFRFSPKYKQYKKCTKVLQDFADEVIAKRRAEKVREKKEETESEFGIKRKVALLDMLLESEKAYNLSNEDIKEEINTFLFAGHDTTSSAICFILLSLADNPKVQEKLYEEIAAVIGEEECVNMQHVQHTKYLDMVIKEVLRMYPAVLMFERRLESNLNIDGIEFPKGTTLNGYIQAAHRNEKYFPNPHIFDPTRFLPEKQAERHNYAYIPFSAGPRNCIGQKFGWYEMKTVTIKLLQKFEVIPVPNFKPDLGIDGILKSYNGIMIRLEPRKK